MSWLKKSLLILLAAVWLPAVSHCDLEQTIGLAFLACDGAAETESHQGADCADDACATLESGFFKLEENSTGVDGPVLWLVAALVAPIEISPATTAYARSANGDELSLSHSWQFACRTALPPRAPSRLA